MPLYRLSGGARERIPASASIPVLESVEEYLDYVRVVRGMGNPAIKFHTQCDLGFDLEMTSAVSVSFASTGPRLMLEAALRPL